MIVIVRTRSGYQHALKPGGQPPTVNTLCGKVTRGPIDSVRSAEDIRCRVCRGLVYKDKPHQTKG